jgi:aspartate aminotransferase
MADPVDLTALARNASGAAPGSRVSNMAEGLIGSEILKIAADIRTLVRQGAKICNLTVGDFSPAQFPIPARLRTAIGEALAAGETNYPPSNGVLELREAVQRFYARELGLGYPVESVLIAGGARPVIYGIYRTLVDPGDKVVYPVPSWNNNHYCHMVGARGVPLPCGPENDFLPTRDAVVRELADARLVCINSPVNPTGTAISESALRGVCEAILEENQRREAAGRRPVYLMYDHIYWMLTVAGVAHVTPPALLPEMTRYTVFVDGISKAFAATGVRVGWAVGPVDVVDRMSNILGHVGAWAPKAEQVATVALLDDTAGIRDYHATFKAGIERRLAALHAGFQEMKAAGLPVESIAPMGAIYLSVRIHPFGRRTGAGAVLQTNDDVRRYLLERAAVGLVPFQAFGVSTDEGWFRLSVGAVSEAEIAQMLPRLAQALRELQS